MIRKPSNSVLATMAAFILMLFIVGVLAVTFLPPQAFARASPMAFGAVLAMLGGIDKFVLRRGQGAIRAELEYKLQPSMRTGGCVFSLDHRIPNGTPFDAYRYYVKLGREILGLPPLDGKRRGWNRMAF